MHNIGKVLWLIIDKTKSIEPVQVISKTTLENLNGSVTKHNVSDSKGSTFCVEECDATIFDTAEEAQDHLLEMAANLVKKLVGTAREKSQAFQAAPAPNVMDQKKRTDPQSNSSPSGLPMVELPDGTMARVHLPESLR